MIRKYTKNLKDPGFALQHGQPLIIVFKKYFRPNVFFNTHTNNALLCFTLKPFTLAGFEPGSSFQKADTMTTLQPYNPVFRSLWPRLAPVEGRRQRLLRPLQPLVSIR
jgi:hypothetical protein